ncbi:MAG: peptidylprolyl isomerase [Bacillota bacterium]|nr:peptidylprolyl isomerase [Bacillota bacterium]
MKNKKIILMLALTLVIGMLSGCIQKAEGDEAAIVNGESISKEAYLNELNIYKNMYEAQYGNDIWSIEIEAGKSFERYLKESVLENMITDKALEQIALENGVEVSDEELESQFETYKSQFPSDEDYQTFLDTNMMTEDYLKNTIRKDQLINEYLQDYSQELEVNDSDLETYYEENKDGIDKVRASHILVEDPMVAQDVLAKLYEGEDFAEMAKEYSIDGSAQSGGDLGFFGKGQMIPEFEEVAFSLEVGELSGLVESQFGVHIIKVTEKQTTFEENKEAVEEQYRSNLFNERVTEIRESADVEKVVDYDNIDLGIEESSDEDPSEEELEAEEPSNDTEELEEESE